MCVSPSGRMSLPHFGSKHVVTTTDFVFSRLLNHAGFLAVVATVVVAITVVSTVPATVAVAIEGASAVAVSVEVVVASA